MPNVCSLEGSQSDLAYELCDLVLRGPEQRSRAVGFRAQVVYTRALKEFLCPCFWAYVCTDNGLRLSR